MFDAERLFDVNGEQTCGKHPYKRLPAYEMSDPKRLFDVFGKMTTGWKMWNYKQKQGLVNGC